MSKVISFEEIKRELMYDREITYYVNELFNQENIQYDILVENESMLKKSAGEKSSLFIKLIFDLLEKDLIKGDNVLLILDQPEDNIDNDYISNYLVPNIKSTKKIKQLIFVTHNPSVAVYGDAFNYIYGSGGLTSKLYKSIREENSLCYAINSMYLKYDGLLMVQISLDQCNVKKAISLVKKELKKMQNGEFSDMELNDAINNMIISLDMSLDNNVAILNNYVFNIYDNLPLIEKRKEYFKEINKNDIINVSKKIKLNTIFTLEGKDS